jgi:hypothetical protein
MLVLLLYCYSTVQVQIAKYENRLTGVIAVLAVLLVLSQACCSKHRTSVHSHKAELCSASLAIPAQEMHPCPAPITRTAGPQAESPPKQQAYLKLPFSSLVGRAPGVAVLPKLACQPSQRNSPSGSSVRFQHRSPALQAISRELPNSEPLCRLLFSRSLVWHAQ